MSVQTKSIITSPTPTDLSLEGASANLLPTSEDVLDEAAGIEQLLLTDARERADRRKNGRSNFNQLQVAAWLIVIVFLFLPEEWKVLPAILLIVMVALAFALWQLWQDIRTNWQEWTQRDVEAVSNLQQLRQTETALIRALLPYSRTALLHVAATARAGEQQVSRRVALALGPNRANGLLGVVLLLGGVMAVGKYLMDWKVKIPVLNTPVTATEILFALLVLCSMSVGILLGGHSTNALLHYAELLERVAAIKKNQADEPK